MAFVCGLGAWYAWSWPGSAASGLAARVFSTRTQARQSDQDERLVRARRAIDRGRYEEADGILRILARENAVGEGALELGLLHQTLGRRDDAASVLEPIVSAAEASRDAELLTRAGRAARGLGQFQDANGLFRRAASITPDDPTLNTAWGELFLEKYNRQDAARSFQAALKQDPNLVPAMIGLARTLTDDNPPVAAGLVERALARDPDRVDAHLFLAEQHLDEGRRAEAKQAIERALAVNPSSLEAHALLAALAFLEGRLDDFQAEVAKALAINPAYGDVYRVAADHAARNYRFEEAVSLARQALSIDPDDVQAHADIGVHLLRTGDEEGARDALERAFDADPYDVVTYNLLGLLDTLDKFETIEEGDLQMRLHADEADVMREYAMPLARLALATLSARYQFEPVGPILVEIFPRHDDFAVRNVGLPGMVGALGACFGRVVTLDSPRARPPGTFNWGATLWHEMAHVITLQMSKQRVPRWLTEGVSVYEEKRARREWGREMELTFAQKLDRGEIFKLRDLNAAFMNPQTISLAYYEASLLVEHIVAEHGEPALHKLLRTYGDGVDTDAALKSAVGVDIDALQVGFDRMLERTFGSLRKALRTPDGLAGAPLEKIQVLAGTHPESYPVQLALGQALWRAGDRDGAMQALERAATLVPVAIGKESPHALMAEIALERGDKTRAIAEFEALIGQDHTDIESARRLVALLDPATNPERLVSALEHVIAIDPFDAAAHTTLGRLALGRKDADTAMREFRVAIAAGPVDAAEAHCDLAESYLLAGRRADAKKQTLAALEVAPSYQRAQDLLLKLLEERQ